MDTSHIHIILRELDEFIRKYYLNEFIKGLILFVLIAVFYGASLSFVEYFAFFPPQIRTVLFYFSLCAALVALVKYVVIPLFHVYRIGNIISYKEAAKIITKFFPEVKDTLFNALELSDDASLQKNELAIAAINQKVATLRPIPFASAIDFKKLLRFGRYGAVLVVALLLISLLYPRAIVEGATRIVKHNDFFEKPAPFSFILDSDSLSVVKGNDFTILMHVEGSFIPDRVEISISGNTFLMTRKTVSSFEYIVRGCNTSIRFAFLADDYSSQTYTLQVLPLPQVLNFSIEVAAPSYTQFENSTITNTGDITFPAGSRVTWNIEAADADSLFFVSQGRKISFTKKGNNFVLNQTITKTTPYSLIGKNQSLDSIAIINYTFTIIPDLRPAIQAEQRQDSTQFFTYYFRGEIQDDYGFSSLEFVYFQKNKENEAVRIPLEFSPANTRQQFFYMFDFSQFVEGSTIQYYFEVFDNDAVNGNKSAKTTKFDVVIPTQKELEQLQEQYSEQIQSSFEQSSSAAQELMKDFDKLKQKLLNEHISDWERKQVLDQMQQKQEQIKQQVEQLQQSVQQKNNLQQKLSDQDEELLKKQQEIENLLNNLMDNELKKMIDEFNSMKEQFNKDEFLKKSDEMKMSYDDLSKQLDRDLELLKRMDVEEQVTNLGDRLQDLADEQQKLSEEMRNGKNSEELQQQIQNVSKELESIKKSYNDALQKNEELQQKFELQNFEKQFNDIQQSMQKSQSEQAQKQQNKSSKSMKDASDQTQQLGQSMNQMMQQQMSKQNMEDMANLRQIMENLLTFSFSQEELLTQTGKLTYADPKYAAITEQQNTLHENFKIIKDSLYALSLRVPQISQPINNEVFSIYKNSASVIDNLEQQQRSIAKINQQYIMTSANNLSLLLSEVLESMQKSAAQQMSGQQQCQNPKQSGKGAKPSFQQMQQMQQSLKAQMQQMMEQMKNGTIPSQTMQKQLSEMLMKEQMLKQLGNSMMKDGELSPEGAQQLKEIQRLMDQTERDIVNQNITPQTMLRQEQIVTRLLEAENAKNERDIDKKRESKTAVENPSETAKKQFKQAEKAKKLYDDVLEENSLKLKSNYQKIFSDYIINLNENN